MKIANLLLKILSLTTLIVSVIIWAASRQKWSEQSGRERRLPTVLVIGAQKCGTTALVHFLSHHPRLAVDLQEEHYFDETDWKSDPQYTKYQMRMPLSSSDQITIEKTPKYFISPVATNAILRYQKHLRVGVRMVLIVREPARRTVASVYHSFYKGRIKIHNLTEILVHKTSAERFLNHSRYGTHFQRWLQVFERQQFLVLDGEKMAKNPLVILTQVEKFLGIENYFTESKLALNNRGYFCHKSSCLERGHKKYPQDLTETAKKHLYESVFREELTLFESLSGHRFQWFPQSNAS